MATTARGRGILKVFEDLGVVVTYLRAREGGKVREKITPYSLEYLPDYKFLREENIYNYKENINLNVKKYIQAQFVRILWL